MVIGALRVLKVAFGGGGGGGSIAATPADDCDSVSDNGAADGESELTCGGAIQTTVPPTQCDRDHVQSEDGVVVPINYTLLCDALVSICAALSNRSADISMASRGISAELSNLASMAR